MLIYFEYMYLDNSLGSIVGTGRSQDTRLQAAQTLTMHVFEQGPKKFKIHEFMYTNSLVNATFGSGKKSC